MEKRQVIQYINYKHRPILDLSYFPQKSPPKLGERCLSFAETAVLIKSFKFLVKAMPIDFPWNPISRMVEKGHRVQISNYRAANLKEFTLTDIKRKIQLNNYKTPWTYQWEVCAMLLHSYHFFSKNSTMSLQIQRVFLLFSRDFDKRMKCLGYCCGLLRTYNIKVIVCQNSCAIQPYDCYWKNPKVVYCVKCYEYYIQKSVLSQKSIRSVNFIQSINFYREEEPFITCKICQRIFHCVCVLNLHVRCPRPEPQRYICSTCDPEPRKETMLRATTLQETEMGQFIENGLNDFLLGENSSDQVFIRVVYNQEHKTTLLPNYRSIFPQYPSEVPYKSKTIFAFQRLEEDICFFAMQVQEYRSTDFLPNSRRAYISYIDSVRLFQPPHLRTSVYHEIILHYIAYLKILGYNSVHMWACPPSQRTDDYIFYRHPSNQKSPNERMLLNWYGALIGRGIEAKIIDSWSTLHDVIKNQKGSLLEVIPYFDGDFWPMQIETVIDVSKQEYFPNGKRPRLGKTFTEYTDEKIRVLSKKNESIFLVINLKSPRQVAGKVCLTKIQDICPMLKCDILETREHFLSLLSSHDLEFGDCRMAKYSTKFIINAILSFQNTEAYSKYHCDHCRKTIYNIRYTCLKCVDFDLCFKCSKLRVHRDPLEARKIGLYVPQDKKNSIT